MQGTFKIKLSISIIALQIFTTVSVISGEQKTIMTKEKKEVVLKKLKKDKTLNNQNWSHSFGLAIENTHYHYIEPDVFQSFVGEVDRQIGARWAQWKGNSWGGSTFYKLTWQDKLFIQPEARVLYGKHQYNWGAKEVLFNKTTHSIPSLIFEPRLTLGGYIHVCQGLTLSPYGGIGYRFKSDDAEDIKTSKGHKLGFYRKSNYLYVPLGTSAEYQLNHTWSVSLKGEYDWIVKAWQYTRRMPNHWTDGYNINYKQPNGYGLKGEVSIGYLYNKMNLSLSPYINYWNIRNSKEKDGGAMEPYNISWETGLKLGVSF